MNSDQINLHDIIQKKDGKRPAVPLLIQLIRWRFRNSLEVLESPLERSRFRDCNVGMAMS